MPFCASRISRLPVFGHHNLTRAQPRQSGVDRIRRAVFQHHAPGRNIAGRDTHRLAQGCQRHQHIGAARIEQRFLGQRARRHETDDIARHQRLRTGRSFAFRPCLGLVRRFDLLGDRYPLARLDQPRQMPFRSVDRHAAHRHGFAPALAPAGQRDVEDGGGAPRIVEEQLEEIAHAIEKQRAFGLTLQRVILLHHRSVAAGHARARAKPWPIREAVRTRFPRAFP